MDIHKHMQQELERREKENALRSLTVSKGLIDFCSNDYLGFARNAAIRSALALQLNELRKTGSTGSRLLTGNNSLIEKAEKDIAAFHGADAALFFNSGYEANVGLLSAVVTRHDTIIFDALCHASLREGIRLSNAAAFSFPHNDMDALRQKCSQAKGRIFIVAESVYSMDGDRCPLEQIINIAEENNANVILDEAHATGVIGKKGEGLAQECGLHKKIFARVHTFGKAIGNNGAVVLGTAILRNYLINFCKPFIYTTAPNMLQIIAVQEVYRLLEKGTEEIARLQTNIRYFTEHIARYKHLHILPSASAIFSVLVPGNENVKLAAQYIRNGGYDVRPVLSPTVPEGTERIRICIHSFNTTGEIDRLIKLLDQFMQSSHD